MKSRALVVASLLVLAGCGGGHGGSAPVPNPTPQATNSPTGAYKQTATLTLVIPLPAQPSSTTRNPQYVSSATSTLLVNVNNVDGNPPPTWVSPNPQTVVLSTAAGGNCVVSGGYETCTIATIPAPPGNVNYTFTGTDGTNALETVTVSQTITQGQNNSLSATLQGIVHTVAISPVSLSASTTTPGAGATTTLAVTPQDYDGKTIIDTVDASSNHVPFSNPFTLTDNDTTGQTSLLLNATTCPGAASVSVTKPTDVVTLCYTGKATNGFTITASGGPPNATVSGSGSVSATVNDITVTGTTVCTTSAALCSSGDPNVNAPTVFFSAQGATATLTAAELGWTQAAYGQTFDLTPSASCGGNYTFSTPTDVTSWNITAASGGALCSATITEHLPSGYAAFTHAGTSIGTVWFSTTTNTFRFN
jgi:hypothetical protein